MLPGVSLSLIDAARSGERGLRGWRCSLAGPWSAAGLGGPELEPPHPKKTQRGEQPPAQEELELPQERGDSAGCHLLCPVPLPQPLWGLVPLAGSELGMGKSGKMFSEWPRHRAQPLWGVSSPQCPLA